MHDSRDAIKERKKKESQYKHKGKGGKGGRTPSINKDGPELG